jgi:hypothetical protein
MVAVTTPFTEGQGWVLLVEVGVIAVVKLLSWLGVRRG